LGAKALTLESKPANGTWKIIHISAEGAHFKPADGLFGAGIVVMIWMVCSIGNYCHSSGKYHYPPIP
jgi:hypothetical protein